VHTPAEPICTAYGARHLALDGGTAQLVNPQTAYDACEAITRREAKNFSYGIRLLETPERQALSSVYALARRIDDIGDGDLEAPRKLEELAAVREQLQSGEAHEDPVMTAVFCTAQRYPLPMHAFSELIEGCEMDVRGTVYAEMDDLVGYCRRVAGTIGRLSVAIFGVRDEQAAAPLADDLGVALQLTNILRDVREDREAGRVYLPSADAARLGCPSDLGGEPSAVASLVAYECDRAQGWFDKGLPLLDELDRRSRACVATMAGIYRRLLTRIQRNPLAVTEGRISVPLWEKLGVAATSLVGRTP
jgi:15-cis-phytoene synthase